MSTEDTNAVVFQPSGRRGEIAPGKTLLEAARELGVDLESVCGGVGACGKCRIRVEEGYFPTCGITSGAAHITPTTPLEMGLFTPDELAAGMRLACQAHLLGDVLVYVPEESRRTSQVVRKEASAQDVPVEPAILRYQLKLPPATLAEPTSCAERLTAALTEQHGLPPLEVDFHVLQSLGRVGQECAGDVVATVWEGRAVTGLDAGMELGTALGLAIDVGTTTIAAYLTDLATGKVLATESAMNPQVAFGEDVISRLAVAAHEEDGLSRLQKAVIDEVNILAMRATERVGISPVAIMDVVVVGNTVMHHLFLGLDPRSLAAAPFAPVVRAAVNLRAGDVGLAFHPGCRLHALPIEAGFVGADNVAVILAEAPHRQDELLLIIDIGTNGELVLGKRHRLLSASCATGPALEGAHTEFGMRAAPGAIERVRIDPFTLDVRFKVIGLAGWSDENPPAIVRARGICGSGIIDAVAQMLGAGVILKRGNFNPDLRHERLIVEDGRPAKFVLARPEETALGRAITISLKDVRAVQLAKAALYAGAKTLLRRYGADAPDRIVLAGAFGSYIDPVQAMSIGLLPDCEPGLVTSVGNAAGHGARLALVNLSKRREAAQVAERVEYVELATDSDFQNDYIEAIHLPHMYDSFPKLTQALTAGGAD